MRCLTYKTYKRKNVWFSDDDGDGSVDEDCRISNAVIARQNVTVFMTLTARLMWTVYSTNITSHQSLQLWKQQVKINPTVHECCGINEINLTSIIFISLVESGIFITYPRCKF